MNCLKCGREIPAQQVFCESCLKEMAGQPVKPGTLVLLPVRNVPQPPRHPKKQRAVPRSEDVILHQRKLIHRLVGAVCVLTLLLGLGIAGAVVWLSRPHQLPIGQNYTTIQD